MEEEGIASLWFGTVDSDEALQEVLEFVYNDDGESSSPFTRGFQTNWIDEDFLEAAKIEPTTRISAALEGASSSDKVIPQMKNLVGEEWSEEFNAIVILYDFNYDGRVKQVSEQGVRLTFVGTVNYRD